MDNLDSGSAVFTENRILDLIPDGIVAADRGLHIRLINPAACRLLSLCDALEYIGGPVSRLMDDAGLLQLLDGGAAQDSVRVTLHREAGTPQLECSCYCDSSRSLFVCVIREAPPQTQPEEEQLRSRLEAAGLADTICEKQLSIVSQIAGLLGEAAVETQAAVYELKKALLPDGADRHG
ncbi:MAG: PAS domain-containing protein [Oscillospiraceae bacterium]|nr:PAS domain-containing protein [Oscillospiraceae bacterium]